MDDGGSAETWTACTNHSVRLGIRAKTRFGPGSWKGKNNARSDLGKRLERHSVPRTEGPVFLKDLPHYINHMWDAGFLSHFNHAFLIRDPAKTITSIYHKWPDFDELEVGFPEQHALFDLLTALNGAPPASG